MAYLGYINVGYAALADIRLYGHFYLPRSASNMELDILALNVLGIANASHAWGNFLLSKNSGRWIMGAEWDRITVLDAVFTVLDGAFVLAYISKF
jgi:hypothetical protein